MTKVIGFLLSRIVKFKFQKLVDLRSCGNCKIKFVLVAGGKVAISLSNILGTHDMLTWYNDHCKYYPANGNMIILDLLPLDISP